jgi:choice-of-anchor A domain-containing protein
MMNLGPLLSASTDFDGEFPLLGEYQDLKNPFGRDDSIGFFVKGNYISEQASEIEGKIVVLGNFTVEPNGVNSLVHAGVGSNIFPNDNQVVMEVGGDIVFKRDTDTWVLSQTPGGGSVTYGGALTETGNGKLNGKELKALFSKQALDKEQYLALFDELAVKSAYWSTLQPNGIITPAIGGPSQNTILFEAVDNNCIQVFHADRFDLWGVGGVRVKFDPSLIGKTILVNVASTLNIHSGLKEVLIDNWGEMLDPWGGNDRSFRGVTKASILWNFYDAEKVTLGPNSGPQFPGTILIPHGDLGFYWPGQDGRTIVGGDVWQESAGSEFHNYEFDPPCPLPLPPGLPVPQECELANPTPAPAVFIEYCYDTDIKVTSEESEPSLPDGALNVDSSDGDKVTFTITQKWKPGQNSISWIAPVYKQGDQDYVCTGSDKTVGVSYDAVSPQYTAQCVGGIAKVELYVHDGSFKSSSQTNDRNCAGWVNNNGIATYKFDLACDGSDLCVQPSIFGGYDCVLPADTSSYSLISKGNAEVSADSVDTGIAVGGQFHYPGTQTMVVIGVSFMGTLGAGGDINWESGYTAGGSLDTVIDFAHFEWLANHALSSEQGGKKVVVMTSGGTFSTSDFRGSDGGKGDDNGNTLAIFKTTEMVTLIVTQSNPFGPSVIAPFSLVELKGGDGYIDGFVVARDFMTTAEYADSLLEMKGEFYTGTISCLVDEECAENDQSCETVICMLVSSSSAVED